MFLCALNKTLHYKTLQNFANWVCKQSYWFNFFFHGSRDQIHISLAIGIFIFL